MAKIVFSPVTAADDAALRRLMAQNVMEGGISVSFRREPSYFAACAVQGAAVESRKGCDTAGNIVILGSRFRRPAYVNGRLCDTGYLADLRVDKAHRSGLLLYRGYKILAERMAAEPLAADITMILQDNAAALATIAANRPGMPRYTPLGRVHTPVIPLLLPRRALFSDCLTVSPATADDLPTLFAFLNREAARRQFAPHYTAADLGTGRLNGLRAHDFLTVRRGGEIAAAAAVWNQHPFRQIHVEGYRGAWRVGQPLYNAAARILRLPRLPAAGGEIRHGYLALAMTANDDAQAFRLLLRAAYREARRRGWHYMVGSLHERDPLLPELLAYPHIGAGGLLFAVSAGEPPKLDGRVPYIDAAAL